MRDDDIGRCGREPDDRSQEILLHGVRRRRLAAQHDVEPRIVTDLDPIEVLDGQLVAHRDQVRDGTDLPVGEPEGLGQVGELRVALDDQAGGAASPPGLSQMRRDEGAAGAAARRVHGHDRGAALGHAARGGER